MRRLTMAPDTAPTGGQDRITDSAARPKLPDVILVLLFVAGSIFAACWIAGFDGFGCWLIGAADILIARSAWRLFRVH